MRKWNYIIIFYLLLLAPVYFMVSSNFYVGYYHDDARYLNYAKAIASWADRNPAFIGPPKGFNYMPGYAVFLAGLVKLFGFRPGLFQLFSVFSILGGLYFFYRYLTELKHKEPAEAFLVLLLASTSAVYFSYSASVLADPLFFFLCFLNIWFFERLWQKTQQVKDLQPMRSIVLSQQAKNLMKRHSEPAGEESHKQWILAGIISGYIFLVRPVGMSMVFAGAGFLLLKKEYRKLLFFCAGTFLFTAAMLVIFRKYYTFWTFNIFYSFYGAKTAAGAGMLSHIFSNIKGYLKYMPHHFFLLPQKEIRLLVPANLLAALAVILKIRKAEISQAGLFFIFYGFILVFWLTPEPRYLMPLSPVIYYSLFSLFALFFRRKTILIPLMLAAYIALMPHSILRFRGWEYRPYSDTISWIKSNIKIDKDFSAMAEGDKFYLLTGIPSVTYSVEPSFASAVSNIYDRGIKYMLHCYTWAGARIPIHINYVLKETLQVPGTFKLLYHNEKEETVVFEFLLKKELHDKIYNGLYKEAEKAFKDKDFTAALRIAEKATALWPDFSFGYILQGMCHFHLGRYEKMKNNYDELIKRNLYEPKPLLDYAEALKALGEKKKLQEIKEKAEYWARISDSQEILLKYRKIFE